MRKVTMLVFICLLIFTGSEAMAFGGSGCAEGECRDCHSFDKKEAEGMLKNLVDKVLGVEFSEVPGFWVVEVEKKGRNYPLYVDFSKSYFFTGNIIKIKSGENVSKRLFDRYNSVDFSKIPLDDALVLGNPGGQMKIIVFTDPQCPYCKQLHVELKKIAQISPEVAFLIKLYPLKMHPEAYGISKSIVCARSMEMLEDSFNDRKVPEPECETDVVDNTLKLVKELGIRSTPTMVFPSGKTVYGFVKAEQILGLIKNEQTAMSDKK